MELIAIRTLISVLQGRVQEADHHRTQYQLDHFGLHDRSFLGPGSRHHISVHLERLPFFFGCARLDVSKPGSLSLSCAVAVPFVYVLAP